MKRRQVDPDRQPVVPADIAAGPEVRRWASPESLQALALLPERPTTKAGRKAGAEAVWACMLSARRRWLEARDEWAAEAGFTRGHGDGAFATALLEGGQLLNALSSSSSVESTTAPPLLP